MTTTELPEFDAAVTATAKSTAPGGELARQLATFFDGCSVLQLEFLSDDTLHFVRYSGSGKAIEEGTGAQLSFASSSFDIIFNLASLGVLDDAAVDRWLAEINRISNGCVWLAVEKRSPRDRCWWEARFIAAGFRKHPLTQAIVPFEELEDRGDSLTIVFEKIPSLATECFPLSQLKAERDLHMDMLREPGIRSDAHLARYELARQQLKPGMVVLDAACGLGYGSAVMAAGTGVARIIGVDVSDWAVEYARFNFELTASAALEFHAGDATKLPFIPDASVDAVVSFETLEHLPNPDLLLREFARVLKPGGLFIGSVPNLWIDEEGRNPVPYHFHIYDHARFHEQIGNYFEWKALLRQNAGGGWKRPQPRTLRVIENLRPSAEDERDAEWWVAVAVKATASETNGTPKAVNRSASIAPAPTPPQTTVKTNAVRPICLATNYLLMTESTRRMWADLGRHLDEQGIQLVLLSTLLPEQPFAFPVYQIPYYMRNYAEWFPQGTFKGDTHVSPRELELLRADTSRLPGNYPLPEAVAGLSAYREFARQLLQELQPGFVLLADNMLCQTAVLQRLCWDLNIPVQIYERGLLPETLMIESRGVQSLSDFRTNWLANQMPSSARDAGAYERLRDYYLARKPQKYTQPDFAQGGQALRQQLGLNAKKLVVFLGGGFEANGHAPIGSNQERACFPAFPSTYKALVGLWGAVQQMPEVALVFKPHPLDPETYAVAKVEGVQVVTDVNVHALIDAADVVAVQFTTLQFETVFYDKPLLLLGKTVWWGRNATYEVDRADKLPIALEAALARHDWATIQANARAFNVWMMDQFLVGCTPEVPARQNLGGLAGFIARTALDSRGLLANSLRVQSTFAALDKLRQPAASAPAF